MNKPVCASREHAPRPTSAPQSPATSRRWAGRPSLHNERSKLLKPFRSVRAQPWADETIAEFARHHGTSEDEMRQQFEQDSRASYFQNGGEPEDYFVSVNDEAPGVMGPVFWLSIRRVDRAAVRDWRHFQEIKNMIFGPRFEAVELYPSSERLVDAANQYHLWVLRESGKQFGIGFQHREIDYRTGVGSSRQRAFREEEAA